MGDGPWGEANGGRKTEKRSYSCSLLGGWKALQGLGDAGKQLRVGERDRKEKEMPGRTMTGLNSNAVCAQAGSTRIALGGRRTQFVLGQGGAQVGDWQVPSRPCR